MSELKITIDQIKNYLGAGLTLQVKNSAAKIKALRGIYDEPSRLERELVYFGSADGVDLRIISEVKPICYRLSDLDKFIPELGFVPIEIIDKKDNLGLYNGFKETQFQNDEYDLLPHWVVKLLFQWHFWPFGEEYFESGLVIDKLKK